MSDPLAAIRRIVSEYYDEQDEHNARRKAFDEQHVVNAERRTAFTRHCRLANASDYAAWLIGYMEAGGQPTHFYDRPMIRPGVTVVGGDLVNGFQTQEAAPDWMVLCEEPADGVPQLYGSQSMNVVVPRGVHTGPMPRTFHGASGHNSLYFMDGFRHVGSLVPLYSDVLPLVQTRLDQGDADGH